MAVNDACLIHIFGNKDDGMGQEVFLYQRAFGEPESVIPMLDSIEDKLHRLCRTDKQDGILRSDVVATVGSILCAARPGVILPQTSPAHNMRFHFLYKISLNRFKGLYDFSNPYNVEVCVKQYQHPDKTIEIISKSSPSALMDAVKGGYLYKDSSQSRVLRVA